MVCPFWLTVEFCRGCRNCSVFRMATKFMAGKVGSSVTWYMTPLDPGTGSRGIWRHTSRAHWAWRHIYRSCLPSLIVFVNGFWGWFSVVFCLKDWRYWDLDDMGTCRGPRGFKVLPFSSSSPGWHWQLVLEFEMTVIVKMVLDQKLEMFKTAGSKWSHVIRANRAR